MFFAKGLVSRSSCFQGGAFTAASEELSLTSPCQHSDLDLSLVRSWLLIASGGEMMHFVARPDLHGWAEQAGPQRSIYLRLTTSDENPTLAADHSCEKTTAL
jgi:hypothetical protein